ncbi:MAG TPA: glycoside hydrolase family 15 protein [Candidatus Dormibacteraeota bacterium]|nr:glycoside hydrolase family 15 protein [Candidatus Dormibacteraeota bacterium]
MVTWGGLPFTPTAVVGPAPGPSAGTDVWTTGDKDAIGTAYERTSHIWFTAVHGAIADVLYPTVDQDNVRQFGYLVTDGKSFLFDETKDGVASSRVTDHRVLVYETTVRDPKHGFALVHDFATDPSRSVLLERSRITGKTAGLHVYAYLVPHLRDNGLGQSAGFDGAVGWVTSNGRWLAAGGAGSGPHVAGFIRRDDGLIQLSHYQLTRQYLTAGDGRVSLTWEVPSTREWTDGIALSSTRTGAEDMLRASLDLGFDQVFKQYLDGWARYAQGLDDLGGQATDLWFHSVEVIKMSEDKAHPGAIVASLALPWGDQVEDLPVDVGYRKVWPRDLYHAARALLAAGDVATALDVARFMLLQQRSDGEMPQNTDISGTPIWPGRQLDETADAILISALFAQMLPSGERPNIQEAAAYIAAFGPTTQQDRWEENSGYSPSTLASEIVALRAAGMKDLAATWNAKLESWTYTSRGYYLRIAPSGQPDAIEDVVIANGGGVFQQQQILDPSFLELVRLGVRAASDRRIVATLTQTDDVVRVDVGSDPYFHRYPHDGYGERLPGGAAPGVGRAWPLLSGERGVYTVLAGGDASPYLRAMVDAAGSEELIPEQVWDSAPLAPTGSARPLVWAHAEYIILAKAVATGHVDDMPSS